MNKILFSTISLCIAFAYLVPQVANGDIRQTIINSKNTIVHVENETWQPDGFENGTVISAFYIPSPEIVIDGMDNESHWLSAIETIVPLGHGNVQTASLKVLYSDEEVFIRIRWKDSTENRDHHPWVWDDKLAKYTTSPQIEDSLLLNFEAGCEWFPSLLGGYVFDFDGWHWMAGRTDPLGQAADLVGTMQDKKYPDKNPPVFASRDYAGTWNLKFTDPSAEKFNANWDELDRAYIERPVSETVYLYVQTDGIGPRYREIPEFTRQLPPPSGAPVKKNDLFPRYQPLRLHGGAGEIAAKGHWEDGYWTVEFRRALITPAGIINDTVFNRLTQFSIYIFDQIDSLEFASESGRLFLRFEKAQKWNDDLLIVKD